MVKQVIKKNCAKKAVLDEKNKNKEVKDDNTTSGDETGSEEDDEVEEKSPKRTKMYEYFHESLENNPIHHKRLLTDQIITLYHEFAAQYDIEKIERINYSFSKWVKKDVYVMEDLFDVSELGEVTSEEVIMTMTYHIVSKKLIRTITRHVKFMLLFDKNDQPSDENMATYIVHSILLSDTHSLQGENVTHSETVEHGKVGKLVKFKWSETEKNYGVNIWYFRKGEKVHRMKVKNISTVE